MIGCAEFILSYDWTFAYLLREYGPEAVERYWSECISIDSQDHARALIIGKGFAGMEEYWGHTLAEEEAGYTSARSAKVFRMDMYACPSQGLLKERGQEHYPDYCEHCMGWIKPVMDDAGFLIHHEHNHNCMCWWEIVPADDPPAPSEPGKLAGEDDMRCHADWDTGSIDCFVSSKKTSG